MTSVPFLPSALPTSLSGACATPSRNSMKYSLPSRQIVSLSQRRQRVHDRDADAVQAAGDLVGILVEFSAGMQLGHDHLGGRHAFALVDVDRNAAAVVAHGAGAVRIERDGHVVGVAGERFVDRVVDDFVDHVMQAGAVIGVADIHARPLANGVEAFQDLDRFRVIIGRRIGIVLDGQARPSGAFESV